MNVEIPCDPVMELALARLEPILSSAGYRLASARIVPEAFGSALTEYKTRQHRLRIVWDGKDQWLWLQVSGTGPRMPRETDWRDLETMVGRMPKGVRLRVGGHAEARMEALEAALGDYLKQR